MNENPYQPPSGKESSLARPGPRWFETKPADWESTAAVSWLTAVIVLMWVGFVPLQYRGSTTPPGWPLIAGPQVIGGIAYIGVALVLALLPAVACAMLHYAAMQMSAHKSYRSLLAIAAKLLSVGVTAAACGLCQLLMIR
ncbi:hypothetical protein [Roseimaritima ulvae]|uniref:Uncharacterized protein n=1 Tax=Roseimaritima ulvae TaxID=980254 RepID=A0A5B9QWB7_9BACT|nr:hypothetical protein [Roseimaritima ulvae]QEG42199.1 hypothetical protein UC8_42330 [Roseimaritima ulvae]